MLSLNSFQKSAENLGFTTEFVSKKPSAVPAFSYPFLLFFSSQETGVALKKSENGKELLISMTNGNSEWMSLSEIDHLCEKKVMYVAPEAASHYGKSTTSKRHWLWYPVRTFWSSWVYMVAAALVINLVGLALPLFIMNVYDRVIPYNSISTLWALVVGVLIALLVDFGLRMFRSLLITNTSRRIDMGISSHLFENALDVTMSERSSSTGELASHIREFESVRDMFTSSGLIALIDLVFIGIFLAALWFIVGQLVLVPLLAVPVVIAITLLLQIPLSKSVRGAQTAMANRHSVLVEALSGVETIKAIAAEGVLQNRWENAVAQSVRSGSAVGFWSSQAMFFTLLIQQSVSVLIITWGVFLIIGGEITIGALIASNILAGRVLAPLASIAMTLVRLQQSISAYRFLDRFMGLGLDHDQNAGTSAPIADAAIQFRNVSFNYPGETKPALDDISFTVTPGERIGILGRVGSGKSSMGKLLCRLYDVNQGAIIMDDTDIRHHSMAALRNSIGYVGQETELFTGTLRDNILIANPQTDHFDDAYRVSGCANFAQTHPLGLEMQIGERGKDLSGGQRQSVALARALVCNHKLLFLDEPTSQMDTASEMAFVHAMKQWLATDKTLLVSTHRQSLLALVSRLIVLDQGKIIADGPKEQVLEKLAAGNVIKTRESG